MHLRDCVSFCTRTHTLTYAPPHTHMYLSIYLSTHIIYVYNMCIFIHVYIYDTQNLKYVKTLPFPPFGLLQTQSLIFCNQVTRKKLAFHVH